MRCRYCESPTYEHALQTADVVVLRVYSCKNRECSHFGFLFETNGTLN